MDGISTWAVLDGLSSEGFRVTDDNIGVEEGREPRERAVLTRGPVRR